MENKTSLIEKLKSERPCRDFVFTAVRTLTNPDEIRQFYKEYTEWLRQGNLTEDPKDLCRKNLGYILGYVDQKVADLWKETIPEIRHPISEGYVPFKG